MSAANDSRPTLLGLSRSEIAQALAPLGLERFRSQQIFQALHQRGVEDFEHMTELSRALRSRLAESFQLGWPHLVGRQPAGDGSEKFLFELADGATIEAVDIPDGKRRTLCISSQAGCALACRFCVTGYWGAGRNLSSGEIVGQVLSILRLRQLESAGINLVFMGMGEPLLNLESLEKSLTILTELISWRRITVSTAGVIPGIHAMAAWPKRPNLAISLHAADDERRSQIMPINRSYPLADLLAALAQYPVEAGRRITFEYILIRGINDLPGDADALVRCLRLLPAKINLIPINPDPVLGPTMVPPDDQVVDRFRDRLRSRGMVVTVRRRRGDDVAAACGQLRAFGRDPRGFRLGSGVEPG